MILLENLRFYPGEKKNDPVFAKQLAQLADVYINDAFPVSHREHASVSAIIKFLPSYAGLRLLDLTPDVIERAADQALRVAHHQVRRRVELPFRGDADA